MFHCSCLYVFDDFKYAYIIYVCSYLWMDGCMDGCMDRCMDVWMDTWIYTSLEKVKRTRPLFSKSIF